MRTLLLFLAFIQATTYNLDSELGSFPVGCSIKSSCSFRSTDYDLTAFKSKCGRFVYAPFISNGRVKMMIFHVESKAIIYKSFRELADINTTRSCSRTFLNSYYNVSKL